MSLLIIYVFLLMLNLFYIFKKKENKILIFISFLILLILMSGNHNNPVVNGKTMDLFYYERDYNLVLNQKIQDSFLYYIFFASQYLANLVGFSYYIWLTVISFFVIVAIIFCVRKFHLDMHSVLFYFMFYIIALYTGLKYFYGMILAFYGMANLIKNNKLKFCIAILIASGIHPMYYFFFVMLFIDNKYFKPKYIFRTSLTLMLFVILFGKNKFVGTISNIIYIMLSDNSITRSVYFTESTNYGFLIPIMLHLISMYYSFMYFKYMKLLGNKELIYEANRIYSLNLMCALLYPLFLIAVTFSRYITVISLITLFLSSRGVKQLPIRYRKKIVGISFVVLLFFGFYFYYVQNYFFYNLIPFFSLN